MSYEYTRSRRDAALVVTKAAPAANANHNTPTLDLEQVTGGEIEGMVGEIEIKALPSLADTKTLTVKLQDSANDSSYADVDPLIQTTVTGVSSAGSAAKTVRFRFPPGTRRYVQLNLAVAASGGDNTGVASAVTFSILT
jgi:hypothetical protein